MAEQNLGTGTPGPADGGNDLAEVQGSPPPIELFVNQSKNGQPDSTVEVEWCGSPELMEWIVDNSFGDPYVLISVTNEGQEMSRKLVPLDDWRVYIQFTRPGTSVIHAMLVSTVQGGKPRVKDLKDVFLTREGPQKPFKKSVLTHTADGFAEDTTWHNDSQVSALFAGSGKYFLRHPGEAQLEVIVPKKFFAKEPAPWKRALIDRFFRSVEGDQCHTRRRFWFVAVPLTVTVYWEYLIAKFVLNVLMAMGAVVAGVRGIGWRFINPLKGGPSSVWPDCDYGSGDGTLRWFSKKDGAEQPTWLQAFNPLTATVALVVGAVLVLIGAPLLAVAITVLVVLGIVALVIAAIVESDWIENKVEAFAAKHNKEEEAAQRRQAALLLELEQMKCDSATGSDRGNPSVRKHSIALIYDGLKKRVCSNYAR